MAQASLVQKITDLAPPRTAFTLRRLYYRGAAAICTLCGHAIRGFQDHGGGPEVIDRRKVVGLMRRKGDMCPICRGRDRTRLVQHWLRHEAGLGREQIRLLQLSPRFGFFNWITFHDKLDYAAAGAASEAGEAPGAFTTAEPGALPFEDGRFDVVVSLHHLHKVPDDAAALREIARVLAPGGAALVLVPEATDGDATDEGPEASAAGRLKRFGDPEARRLYARGDVGPRLAAAGLEVEDYAPVAGEPKIAERLKLDIDMVLHVGRKPA